MNETALLLESTDQKTYFPPLSVRECRQTLSLLPCGELRRTIAGSLVHVGRGGIQKFHSIITCEDRNSPAFEKVKMGTVLKVGCLPFLTQPILQGKVQAVLERDPVVYEGMTLQGERLPLERCEGRTVFLPKGFPGGFITYRPWLVMLVKTYHLECDEWGALTKWRIELEEK